MSNQKIVTFSIIVPTYNRAWCIERAINSVLCQEFENWEMIIVDDGSVDDTKSIIEKCSTDERIKYFYKKNGGVGSARNFGIRHATGKLIMFLDSDDELIRGVLGIIFLAVSKYEHKNIFSFRAIDQNGRQISYTDLINKDQSINFSDFISQKYIKGEAFLVFKKNVFSVNLFDEDVSGGEGLLLFGLIEKYGLMMINVDARIYHIGSGDSIISSNLTLERVQNICKIQIRLIERYENILKVNNRKYLGTAYLVLARSLALSGKRVLSLKYFFFGCFYNIFDIKRIVLYGVSVFDYKFKINNTLNSFAVKRLL